MDKKKEDLQWEVFRRESKIRRLETDQYFNKVNHTEEINKLSREIKGLIKK